MKKWISLFLASFMVLSLLACGSPETAKDKAAAPYTGLEVGYSRVEITPDYPVKVAGSASDRTSTGLLDPLYATCIALRRNEETFLLVTWDLVGVYDTFAAPVRTAMSSASGISEEHIIINATHTHSSVAARDISDQVAAQYLQEFITWAETGAEEALEDLSPAEIHYGSIQTQGMAWVRHYKMKDGTYAGANYGSFASGIVGHASEADGELQVIRFVRSAEDKKDVVLMNFPAHATMNGSETNLSADFPGPAREYVAENTNTLVAYFIAAAGDQVPTSRVATEQFSSDYRIYGEELGKLTVVCMENLTKSEASDLRFSQRTFIGNSNKEDLDRLGDAKAVQAIWNQVGGRGTDKGRQAAKDAGFSSVYEVTAILNRANFADTRSMELKALALGDVSMIFAPYEMFGSNGLQIKTDSPYDMTFVVTCSYGHEGYLPSQLGWEIRCYEAQITKYARGTAEQLVAEYVSILTEMKNQ